MLYSTDASLYQIQPVGVVIPKRVEDVQATVEIAARRKVPVLPRGGGSSLAGQAVGAAIVLDFSKYMADILAHRPGGAHRHRPAGHHWSRRSTTHSPQHGLMLGPDPASADRATMGGSVGNNATGSHSILYGMMADHVQRDQAILADGSTARLWPAGRRRPAPPRRAATGWKAHIYARMPAIVHEAMDEILHALAQALAARLRLQPGSAGRGACCRRSNAAVSASTRASARPSATPARLTISTWRNCSPAAKARWR